MLLQASKASAPTSLPPVQLRKALDVELLLQWAYLHELPKRKISSAEGIWDRLTEYGSMGGISVGRGAAQRYAHFGLPHPDAERVEKAVNALPAVVIDWNRQFPMLAGDLASLVSVNDVQSAPARERWTQKLPAAARRGADGRGISASAARPRDVLLVNTINVEALVYSHAVKGSRPGGWDTSDMRPIPTLAERGSHAKIIGICKGKNSYTSGSFCPLRWSPSPVAILLARANYFAWHLALRRLADELDLAEHVALPPMAPPCPWGGQGEPIRWLIGPTRRRKQNPLPLRPQRQPAGPAEKPPRYPGRRIFSREKKS